MLVKCICCDKQFNTTKSIVFTEANFENGTFPCCLNCYREYNSWSYNKIHLSFKDKQKIRDERTLNLVDVKKLLYGEKFEDEELLEIVFKGDKL